MGDLVRSRFVAQEFASGDPREDLFAGTPPLFASRLVVSTTASRRQRGWSLMALDIGCAFLYAKATRELYIELPDADPLARDGRHVGRLLKALYGTRDAPQRWQQELSETLHALGFQGGRLLPGVFWNSRLEVILVSHVDDLLLVGPEVELNKIRAKLGKQ